MKLFLSTLPRNIIACFKGRMIIWHVIAIAAPGKERSLRVATGGDGSKTGSGLFVRAAMKDLRMIERLARKSAGMFTPFLRLEGIAQVIYQAATDGTDQLRYVTTEDIKPPIKARRETSEEEYLALMPARFGSKRWNLQLRPS
jgi:hypothetical protein